MPSLEENIRATHLNHVRSLLEIPKSFKSKERQRIKEDQFILINERKARVFFYIDEYFGRLSTNSNLPDLNIILNNINKEVDEKGIFYGPIGDNLKEKAYIDREVMDNALELLSIKNEQRALRLDLNTQERLLGTIVAEIENELAGGKEVITSEDLRKVREDSRYQKVTTTHLDTNVTRTERVKALKAIETSLVKEYFPSKMLMDNEEVERRCNLDPEHERISQIAKFIENDLKVINSRAGDCLDKFLVIDYDGIPEGLIPATTIKSVELKKELALLAIEKSHYPKLPIYIEKKLGEVGSRDFYFDPIYPTGLIPYISNSMLYFWRNWNKLDNKVLEIELPNIGLVKIQSVDVNEISVINFILLDSQNNTITDFDDQTKTFTILSEGVEYKICFIYNNESDYSTYTLLLTKDGKKVCEKLLFSQYSPAKLQSTFLKE